MFNINENLLALF